MFERYTEECKRAIFLSHQTALHQGADAINSTHLLLGLLRATDGRANRIFSLRELLQEEVGQLATLRQQQLINERIPLSVDGKRVVLNTAREANRLRDYWIDDEHLVLGILRENENAAAARLRAIGLDLETARLRVVENIGSRPQRPNPVLWWVRRRSIGFALVVVFLLGIVTALILLGFGGVGIAIIIVVFAIGQGLNSLARRRSFTAFGNDDV